MDEVVVAEQRGSAQDLRMVWRAEAARWLRRGGIRTGLILTCALSTGLGLAALAILVYISDGQIPDESVLAVTASVETAITTAAIVLSVFVVMHVGRVAHAGPVRTSLVLVPDRTRLLAAYAATTASVGVGVAVGVATAVAATAFVVTGSVEGLVRVAVCVAVGALATVLVALVALSVALLVDQGIVAVVTHLCLLIVLPLVLLVAGTTVSGRLSTIVEWASGVTPAPLLAEAVTAATRPASSPWPAMLGLTAWVLAVGLPASLRFSRQSV